MRTFAVLLLACIAVTAYGASLKDVEQLERRLLVDLLGARGSKSSSSGGDHPKPPKIGSDCEADATFAFPEDCAVSGTDENECKCEFVCSADGWAFADGYDADICKPTKPGFLCPDDAPDFGIPAGCESGVDCVCELECDDNIWELADGYTEDDCKPPPPPPAGKREQGKPRPKPDTPCDTAGETFGLIPKDCTDNCKCELACGEDLVWGLAAGYTAEDCRPPPKHGRPCPDNADDFIEPEDCTLGTGDCKCVLTCGADNKWAIAEGCEPPPPKPKPGRSCPANAPDFTKPKECTLGTGDCECVLTCVANVWAIAEGCEPPATDKRVEELLMSLERMLKAPAPAAKRQPGSGSGNPCDGLVDGDYAMSFPPHCDEYDDCLFDAVCTDVEGELIPIWECVVPTAATVKKVTKQMKRSGSSSSEEGCRHDFFPAHCDPDVDGDCLAECTEDAEGFPVWTPLLDCPACEGLAEGDIIRSFPPHCGENGDCLFDAVCTDVESELVPEWECVVPAAATAKKANKMKSRQTGGSSEEGCHHAFFPRYCEVEDNDMPCLAECTEDAEGFAVWTPLLDCPEPALKKKKVEELLMTLERMLKEIGREQSGVQSTTEQSTTEEYTTTEQYTTTDEPSKRMDNRERELLDILKELRRY